MCLQIGIVALCIGAVVSILLLGKPVIDTSIAAFPMSVEAQQELNAGPVVPLLDDEFAL